MGNKITEGSIAACVLIQWSCDLLFSRNRNSTWLDSFNPNLEIIKEFENDRKYYKDVLPYSSYETDIVGNPWTLKAESFIDWWTNKEAQSMKFKEPFKIWTSSWET